MSQNNLNLAGEATEVPTNTHSYNLRNENSRATNVFQNNVQPNSKFISLKRKRTSKKSLITRKINQINSFISERGSRTKILYLKNKLMETLRETEVVNDEMKEIALDENIDFDPGWIEDVIFNIDTCNSCVQEYIDLRKDDSSSGASSKSIKSWIRHCELETIDFENQQEKETPEENLSDLTDKLNNMTIKSAEKESKKESCIPNHPSQRQVKSEVKQTLPSYNKPLSKDKSSKITEQPQEMRDYKSMSLGQLHENIWKNPLKSIPFDLEREEYSNKFDNRQRSYDPSFRKPNYQPTFKPNEIKGNSIPIHINSYYHKEDPIKYEIESVRNKSIDSWIDELNPYETELIDKNTTNQDITMAWLLQQNLPRIEIPIFNGSPLKWVEFVIKFKEIVHNHVYLSNTQKLHYLQQHVSGIAKRAILGFANDERGYVLSLKRLKYSFGQKSRIVEAHLTKVTKGKQIANDDDKGLLEFYYSLSDCLITLRQLDYESDIYSVDTLRQVIRRLPNKFYVRWGEHCLNLRRVREPTLVDMEAWLHDRIEASTDPYLPPKLDKSNLHHPRQGYKGKHSTGIHATGINQKGDKSLENNCILCKEKHRIYKCQQYRSMNDLEKFKTIRANKLCFNCFQGDHFTSKCKSKNTCFKNDCTAKHHTTLHNYFASKHNDKNKSKEDPSKKNSENKKEDEEKSFTGMTKQSSKGVFMQIVPVKVKASNGKIATTYALLDNGSESTLIRDDFAESLKLKGCKKTIAISTITNETEEVNVKEVTLKILDIKGENELKVSALTLPKNMFNMPSQSNLEQTVKDQFDHLKDIEISNVKTSDIKILIGANAPEAFIQLEVRKGHPNEPYAIKTALGWSLLGKLSNENKSYNKNPQFSINRIDISTRDKMLNELVKRFWECEDCYSTNSADIAMSREDKDCLNKLDSETKLVDGKFQVPMLWKKGNQTLDNNYEIAFRRLKPLHRRFRKDPELYIKYKETIENHIKHGYAKKLTKEEREKVSDRTWYLPHHPVFHPRKPGKPRVVFDAAAQYKGKSLNSTLCTGPDLLNSLMGVLLRFRNHNIAIVADIEAMFHQVRVEPSDSDSLRFLWADTPHENSKVETYQMLVHIFGATDSPCCTNFAVKKLARDNSDHYSAMTIETVLRSFYVDDLLKSVASEQEAINLIKELIKLMKAGGFRLTKFISNNKAVMKTVPETEKAKSIQSANFNNDINERTLGIKWDLTKDSFTFESLVFQTKEVTKRTILKIVASIFDPLGFVSPYVLTAKIFLQELWRMKIDWDTVLDDHVKLEWKKWLTELSNITKIEIARVHHPTGYQASDIELHIFCDASEKAYGAVAYLKFQFMKNKPHCSFVMAKNRLAPIKTISLPRLELNAAVLGIRLYKSIIKELDLPISQTMFWTDSTLVLQYLRNETQRFKTYVANRVTEILDESSISQWHHVPSESNPADICSRGVVSPIDLLNNNKNELISWYNGPNFLWSNAETTRNELEEITELPETNEEIKRSRCFLNKVQKFDISINFERISNWKKLIRVIAYVNRFIRNCKLNGEKLQGVLSAAEMKISEEKIIKLVQQESLNEEYNLLLNKREVANGKLKELCPFLDEKGTMRVGGRLKRANIPYEWKHQIILPNKHHVTTLIVREYHSYGHLGPEYVLSNIRKTYWIIKGRSTIKQVARRCTLCQRRKAKSMQPKMSDLPFSRLEAMKPPFSSTGIDLFGPITIKQRRARIKRWGALFSCFTTRAIHLEVVEGLDTDSFIGSLQRFVNRRGKPEEIYSDCGTNFKGTTSELNIQTRRVNEYASNEKITWHFNPPAAPHMGGVWERIVRTVKRVMFDMIKNTVLTEFQLMTIFTEVEAIVNNRPLTYLSDNPDDLEPLTPNHLLIGRYNGGAVIEETDGDMSCRRRWKQVVAISNQFWKRWLSEYLPTLQSRRKWNLNQANIETGAIVLLKEENASRGKWPLARIIDVHPSSDGIVRVVKVKTITGEYTRPVVKIFPLECDNDFEVPQGGGC